MADAVGLWKRVMLLGCMLGLLAGNPLPASGEEKRIVNSIGMEFVLISAGSFVMGSPPGEDHRDESEVQHIVELTKPFYLQTTEVTLGQWRALMGRKLFGPRKGPEDLPVTRVSWQDCQKFIQLLNQQGNGHYRLPTEAEWEYACRAGTTTAYSWGDTIDCTRAMFANNSMKVRTCQDYARSRGLDLDGPAPVMSYPPNAWGLYDMHGNVWEWCQDCYAVDCSSHHGHTPGGEGDGDAGGIACRVTTLVDPLVATGGMAKVRRGGSWFKHGYACRSANRAFAHTFSKLQTTGFRLVRDVK